MVGQSRGGAAGIAGPEGGAAAVAAAVSFSESQLDELARAVQAEVVQPLHVRIRDLTMQVQTLREETRSLEARWQACAGGRGPSSAERVGAPAAEAVPSPIGAVSPEQVEARRAAELEAKFRAGHVEEAMAEACLAQERAEYEDFVGRLCHLVDGGAEEAAQLRLGMPGRLQLMLALSTQCEAGNVSEERRALKVEWVYELWDSFAPDDPTVSVNTLQTFFQVLERLERTLSEEQAFTVRSIKNSARAAVTMLQQQR